MIDLNIRIKANILKGIIESFIGVKIDRRFQIEAFIIILLGLIVLTWYNPGQSINWFDYGFSYKPNVSFEKSLFLWDNTGSMGYPNPRVIAGLFPNSIYYLLMDGVGIDIYWSQVIFIYCLLVVPGITSYYLFRRIEGSTKYNPGAIFCALTYMFSPYVSSFVFNQFSSSFYSYAFIPLILGLVYGGLKNQRSYRYFIAVALIWAALVTPSYMNPVHAVLDWFIIISISIFIIFGSKELRIINVKKLSVLLIVWTILSLYWIIPQIEFINQIIENSSIGAIGLSNIELLKSNSVPFYKEIFQTGYWALYHTYLGDHWYTWWEWASSPIFYLGCVFMTSLAIISIVVKPKIIAPFLFLSLISLVMINGAYPPTGDLLIRIFDSFPPLYSLRSLVQKFGFLIALSFSIMAAVSIAYFYNYTINIDNKHKIKKLISKVPFIFVILIILSAFAFPFMSGEVVYRGGDVIPSAVVEIPDYYSEANEFFNSDIDEYNIFPLPLCKINYEATNWSGGYWGLDTLPYLIDKCVLSRESGDMMEFMIEIAEGISTNSNQIDAGKILSIINVKYIILFNDTNWEFIDDHDWWVSSSTPQDVYYNNLQEMGFIHVIDIGKLCIFINPEWKDIHYYTPEYIIKIPDGVEGIKNLTLQDWYRVDKYAFVFENSSDLIAGDDIFHPTDQPMDQSDDENNITIIDETPSRRVIGTKQAFEIIVFSERYYDHWNLHVDADAINHVEINGYMNGWIVSGMTGNECMIEFDSQKYFDILIILCIISWMIIATTIIFYEKLSIIKYRREK